MYYTSSLVWDVPKMGDIKKEKQKEFETSQKIGAMKTETNRQKLMSRDNVGGALH